MATWLRKLMPQHENFFPLFEAHAAAVVEASNRLQALLGSPGGDDSGLAGAVDDGRATAGKILEQIRRTFVTPFDRSDIKEMTASMQSLLDDMQSVARSLRSGPHAGLGEFGQLLADCARELQGGVAKLTDFDKHADDLMRMRQAIGQARSKMLELRERKMTELLANGLGDPVGTLASTHLLQRVAALVDDFDAVADHIDDLVLDHV